IHRRISQQEIKRYDQLFPYLKSGSLLSDQAPEPFSLYLRESCSERFIPESCLTCIDESHVRIATAQPPYSTSEEKVSTK
ncbi:MAG: hypothetical protein P8166_14465, partial [Candidatus Thiodiazotropha sp.]